MAKTNIVAKQFVSSSFRCSFLLLVVKWSKKVFNQSPNPEPIISTNLVDFGKVDFGKVGMK